MKESWRWFGPLDKITLPEIVQTGAAGIVTALHEIPYGDVWPREVIAARSAEISAVEGVEWAVVEWIWTIDLGLSDALNHIFYIRWYSSIFS